MPKQTMPSHSSPRSRTLRVRSGFAEAVSGEGLPPTFGLCGALIDPAPRVGFNRRLLEKLLPFLLLLCGFQSIAGHRCVVAEDSPQAASNATDALRQSRERASAGVKVPEGFEVALYADDGLAHDIFSMTIDSRGRVVVSGPGYVRILLDTDDDGYADTFKQFADGPKTGAQGLFFHGRDLLCVGDAGLLRYRDRNGDDRADAPPDVFLRIKTGGEHHAHAVRKGPDGWWYLIAGNHAGVTERFASLSTSPIKRPESGTLLRLKPDLSGGEIFSHGFRNAYDFAFNRQGDVVTYDSDGERDVSLPWYRPTRVFHTLPASHAGWVSRSWKRPRGYPDMPPVVGAFGRGSPTGVVCYRHHQFPATYHNAVFALDWTFGRVMALPLERDGSTWTSEPVTFMTGVGEFGFAPTDAAVGPDGSLFVSVGGRGTRGGVFRVRYVGKTNETQADTTTASRKRPDDIDKRVWNCLTTPQPLSSFARATWMPAARQLGPEPFRTAAKNTGLSARHRLRAIEILTELHGGLTDDEVIALSKADSPDVRARAVWSHGRLHAARPNADVLLPFLSDSSPPVRRAAVEALLGAGSQTRFKLLLPVLAERLADDDRAVRLVAMHVTARLPQEAAARLKVLATMTGTRSVLGYELGRLLRKPEVHLDAFSTGLSVLERTSSADEQLDAVRLLQVSLGNFGPRKQRPPVFDSYDSRLNLERFERQLDPFRIRLSKVFPTGRVEVDFELARVVALLSPYNPTLLQSVLKKITPNSHPTADVHHLIVAARIPVERNAQSRTRIARALIGLDAKLRGRKLNRDTNWDDRISEMYKRHVAIDPALPQEIIQQPEFGQPDHVLFLNGLPEEQWQNAIDAFARRIQQSDDYTWTPDVVFLLGESDREAHRDLIRRQFNNFGLRNAVLLVLAGKPAVIDREKFVRGLQSGQLKVIGACVAALEKFPPADAPRERFALFKAARRLGRDKREIPVRDRLMKLLAQSTGTDFGYEFQADARTPQSAALKRAADWLKKRHPAEARRMLATEAQNVEQFKNLMAKADWDTGDAVRGAELFRKRSCVQCHGRRRALGPDLAGVARRFSRDDFFTAILQPDRDVSPRYQTTQIVTAGGKSYVGLIVYESVDGVTLRTGQNQTIRIEAADIEARRRLNTSLMPKGLLKGLKPQDLADLYAYVRSLAR